MELLISAHGARVVVEQGAPEGVYRRLRTMLPRGMATEVPDIDKPIDARYGAGPDEHGGYRIVRDGAVVDRARSLRDLCCRLRDHIELDIARQARTALFVRAGVVAWRGRAILIPGSGNAGTSTLVGELVRRGATYYSDEYAVIDEAGMVHPYGRGSASTHRVRTPEPPPITAALLIATTYAPEAKWAPVVLEGARALLPVLEHVPAMRAAPRRALRFAARLGPRLVALRGQRPEAQAVAPAVLEFMDRVLDGMQARPALADSPRSASAPAHLRDVIEDPSWVPVAVSRTRRRVRFRRYARPFHIAHAGTVPRPWDVELPLGEVEVAAAARREPAKVVYVYHHGYAGSTLLFRLLDAPGVCLAYDEPNIHFHCYANAPIRALCYRTFRATETPLIKAVPSEIINARHHFADHPEARAVFLYASLEEYVASALPYAYRRKYMTKLARFLGGGECASAADAAVYCWERITAEVLSLAAQHPLKTVEASAFFADPERHLAAIWEWFGFPRRDDWSATLARVGSTHAKNRRPFTPADRLVQKRDYAEQARPWLEEHATVLAAAQEPLARLGRLNLCAPAGRRDATSRLRGTRTRP